MKGALLIVYHSEIKYEDRLVFVLVSNGPYISAPSSTWYRSVPSLRAGLILNTNTVQVQREELLLLYVPGTLAQARALRYELICTYRVHIYVFQIA